MNTFLTTSGLLVVCVHTLAAGAPPLRFMSWNLEGNGQADPVFLRQIITDFDGVDIWGSCEARDKLPQSLEQAAEADESIDYAV